MPPPIKSPVVSIQISSHTTEMESCRVNYLLLFFFFFFFFLVMITKASADDGACVYTLYVKTGTIKNAGTKSRVRLTLSNSDGDSIEIPNIKPWGGLMGANYNYFEKGNIDIFTGTAKCLVNPVCSMNLTSDGSGHYPGWYCDYVEVTSSGSPTSGIPCNQKLFTVEQWLRMDASPYKLYANRDECNKSNANAKTQSEPELTLITVN